MACATILDLASNQETSRRLLERIATLRFGVTRGGLSALRNRDALVEKLRTLIGNESTHDSIHVRQVNNRPDDDPPRKRVKSEVGAETVLIAGSSLLTTKRVARAGNVETLIPGT